MHCISVPWGYPIYGVNTRQLYMIYLFSLFSSTGCANVCSFCIEYITMNIVTGLRKNQLMNKKTSIPWNQIPCLKHSVKDLWSPTRCLGHWAIKPLVRGVPWSQTHCLGLSARGVPWSQTPYLGLLARSPHSNQILYLAHTEKGRLSLTRFLEPLARGRWNLIPFLQPLASGSVLEMNSSREPTNLTVSSQLAKRTWWNQTDCLWWERNL